MVALCLVPTDATDAELARRIAAGDADAETILCRKFAARIRLYGLRHLGSDHEAGDLVQLVLVKVIEALRAGRVEDPEHLGSFVLGTSRHVAWDLRRAESRQRAITGAAGVLHVDVEAPATSAADLVRMLGCVQRLPERERAVVRMSFMEERSSADIGRSLGLREGNVRVVRHRALARLHDCLEQGGGAH